MLYLMFKKLKFVWIKYWLLGLNINRIFKSPKFNEGHPNKKKTQSLQWEPPMFYLMFKK